MDCALYRSQQDQKAQESLLLLKFLYIKRQMQKKQSKQNKDNE